jgi:hypothetical protein
MSADDVETPLWRRLVINRFVLVPATIASAVLLWNVYVSTHNHGVVSGLVVDAAGRPVPEATVVLWVLNFTTYVEKTRVTTDSAGALRHHQQRFPQHPARRRKSGRRAVVASAGAPLFPR